jgi:hypothetical protein
MQGAGADGVWSGIDDLAYGEPIRDAGHREHEGAGRPPIDRELRARARYMAAPDDFPGCAVSADL